MTPQLPAPSPDDDREQEESQARLEAGGIPLAAERRLRELGEGAGAFTSDLSVGSFALCHELGLTPLAQVMGSSVYQVGYQYGNAFPGVGLGSWMYELDALSGAWNESRNRAFARLALEAEQLGADAVVGVQINRGEREFTEGGVECMVVGTAVRRGPRRSGGGGGSGSPVLTELSVPDYAKLQRAGLETLGVVAWTSVFFVQSWTAAQLSGGFGFMQNQEIGDYTRGIYEARESVMARVTAQAAHAGASGVVGMRVGHTVRPSANNALIVSFDAIGTAIRQTADFTPQPPKTIIDLTEGANNA